MARKREDLTGMKFNYFTVLEFSDKRDKNGRPTWKCQCVCGEIRYLPTSEVRRQKSCGCMKGELQQKARTKHNMSDTRLYRIWDAMKGRCYRKSHNSYKYYGGRGIKICDEWKDSFEEFMNWALANGYEDSLSIDRKDSDGNYEPSNCKWSTQEEQIHNRNGYTRKTSKKIEFNGKVMSIDAWAKEVGISPATLRQRINNGWDIERALTEKPKK